MNIKPDISDYYPWGNDRRRPAEKDLSAEKSPQQQDGSVSSQAQTPSAQEETAPSAQTEIYAATAPPADAGINEPSSDDPVPPEAPPGIITIISHFLSWVLSPVVVPTYGIIAVFMLSMFSYAPAASKWLITGIVFAITGVIPSAAIFVLTKFGDVKDMALTRRSDRLFPYIITAACLLACGIYLTRTGLPDWVGLFYIGASVATAINLIVNFKWKISAHGAGIGGFIAMLMILNHYGLPAYNLWGWVIAAVIAAGLLSAARVWLWRHTPMQTIAGEIVGFICVILTEALFN